MRGRSRSRRRFDSLRLNCSFSTVKGLEDRPDVARRLSDAHGMMCRTGHFCAQPLVDAHSAGRVLRASAYVYNTLDELNAFFAALDEEPARCACPEPDSAQRLCADVERGPHDHGGWV
jgi:hypothetical protein